MPETPRTKPYSIGIRVKDERSGVRHPFRDALRAGVVSGWEACVVLEDFPVRWKKTAPDLIALREDGHLALIECKRATSGQAKKGMFEQVLLYGELLQPLLSADKCDAFEAQCRLASHYAAARDIDRFIRVTRARTLHLWLVVDRWSGKMDQTARLTWEFMNRALDRERRPPIRIWATGGLSTPLEIAPHAGSGNGCRG